jgi:ATP-dependent DNA helicase RecQ
VLHGRREIELRVPKQALAVQPRRKKRAGSRSLEFAELEPGEQQLFDALRALRRTIATELAVPPYVVFSDATLAELARARPSSPAALLGVKGVGDKKREAFGARFLAEIAARCDEFGLELDTTAPPHVVAAGPVVHVEREPEAARAPARSAARDAAEALFAEGVAVDDVARRIGRAPSTTWQYLEQWIRRERPTGIEAWVAPDVEAAVAEVLDASDDGRLKPVFDALGGAVPYEAIRIVVAHRSADAGSAADEASAD